MIVDPKGRDYRKYGGASPATPNLHELREVTGIEARTDQKSRTRRRLSSTTPMWMRCSSPAPSGGSPWCGGTTRLFTCPRWLERSSTSLVLVTPWSPLSRSRSQPGSIQRAGELANLAAGIDDVVEQAQRRRAEGRRIRFTNGCFDLIHPGHISLLSQGAAQCERLIVGLNTDASIHRVKGQQDSWKKLVAVIADAQKVYCVETSVGTLRGRWECRA